MERCRVSVVVPTRDRLGRLRRALESAGRQTFRDFDIWVVDDGSRDGTAPYLSGPGPRDWPGDGRFHVLREDRPVGAAAARNRALERAGGELIAFLDDDDVWHRDYLRHQVDTLDRWPSAGASVAGHTLIDGQDRSRDPDTRPLLAYSCPLVHMATELFIHTMSAVVCRREALEAVGPLDPGLRICHDVDWYVRLLQSGRSIVRVDGPALVVRESPGGLVRRHREWFREERAVLDRVFREDPECARERSRILAHRSLLFARVALRSRDYVFAGARLRDAWRHAPVRSTRIALLRLGRNLAGSAGSSRWTGGTRSMAAP